MTILSPSDDKTVDLEYIHPNKPSRKTPTTYDIDTAFERGRVWDARDRRHVYSIYLLFFSFVLFAKFHSSFSFSTKISPVRYTCITHVAFF